MPAAGGGNPGALSGAGACARQMVHGRHSLPCADPEGRGDGRGPCRCDAASARGVRQRAHPRKSTASRPSAPASSSPRSRSGSPTWTGWGSTSRRSRPRRTRPITAPTPISGSPRRASSTTISPTSPAVTPTALSALGTVPFQAPDLAVAELDRIHKSLGLSRHRDRDQCRRRGFLGRALPQDLRPDRGTRPPRLHAPDRLSRGAALRRPLPRQRDRQPARFDGRRASPDLWRRACTTTPT